MDLPVQRVHFFQDQLLGAADFEAEQEYHRRMRHLHVLVDDPGLDLVLGRLVRSDGEITEVDISVRRPIGPADRQLP